MARLSARYESVRRMIEKLLADIGKAHPQALIYSLTVASKSQSVSRRSIAMNLLDRMREHSSNLVKQVSFGISAHHLSDAVRRWSSVMR